MSLVFDSRRNYLKQFEQGSAEMEKPDTLISGLYQSTYTITHNLGYRPLVRAWYDPDGSGTIYPLNGQNNELYSELYATGEVPFMFFVDEITDTYVTFMAEDEASNTGTFTFYYKIYLDPTV